MDKWKPNLGQSWNKIELNPAEGLSRGLRYYFLDSMLVTSNFSSNGRVTRVYWSSSLHRIVSNSDSTLVLCLGNSIQTPPHHPLYPKQSTCLAFRTPSQTPPLVTTYHTTTQKDQPVLLPSKSHLKPPSDSLKFQCPSRYRLCQKINMISVTSQISICRGRHGVIFLNSKFFAKIPKKSIILKNTGK